MPRLTIFLLLLLSGSAFADPITRAGAGFLITPDGYLLTARHLVEDAEQINVRLPDGRELPGTIVASGTAPSSDLALVKIDATGLPALPLALTATPQVGDAIEAVGFPSITDTVAKLAVASGHLHALPVPGEHPRLQLSVNIQPGHSGGPILNDQGQVIALADHRQFLTAGRFTERLNLAIPIAQAEPLLHQTLPDLPAAPPPPAALTEKEIWEKAAPALVLLRVQAPFTPTAALPAVVSADPFPPALTRFIQDFALSGESPSADYAASFYQFPADYLGLPGASQGDALAAPTAFRARWPERQFAVSPEGILLVQDPSNPKQYFAYYDLTFTCQNGDKSYGGESACTATISVDSESDNETPFHVHAFTEKILTKFEATFRPAYPAHPATARPEKK